LGTVLENVSHRYIPNSASETKKKMMDELGIKSIDELLRPIPKKIRCKKLDLPDAMSEAELIDFFKKVSGKNKTMEDMPCFIGNSAENHHVPACVDMLSSLPGLLTSYTQYQAEISQGYLQALWESHDMFCSLSGMRAATNMYDGATTLSEAILLAGRMNSERNKFLIPKNLSPGKRRVIDTYLTGSSIKLIEVDYDKELGSMDIDDLESKTGDDTIGIYVENPNFFGVIETDVKKISKIAEENCSYFVVGANPISLGVLEAPGNYGADIVVMEGQSLGSYPCFGGPMLGILGVKGSCYLNRNFMDDLTRVVRQMPGRLIGMDVNHNDEKSYSIIAQTREQHIKRERATSNICTNSALMALRAGIFLSYMGPEGMKELGIQCMKRAAYLKNKLENIDGVEAAFKNPHFHEFVVRTDKDSKKIDYRLKSYDIPSGTKNYEAHSGIILDNDFPELGHSQLFCATEANTKEEMDKFYRIFRRAVIVA